MALSYTDAAAEVMEHLCGHSQHGYSQPNRQGIGTGGSVGETITLSDGTSVGIAYGDRDCSSAVIESFESVGVSCGGATYTGDMKRCMVSSGNFKALPASTWRDPQRGDVLLNQGKHTALALGGGKLGEFLRSEYHTITGKVGDQDGGESVVRALYDDDWDVVLRYCGPARAGSQTSSDGPSQASAGVIWRQTSGNTYQCVDETGSNVRALPSTSAEVVTAYGYGQTVVLDNWSCVADGWLWGRYTGGSGFKRYVAVKRAAGSGATVSTNVPAGTYLCEDPDGVPVRTLATRSAATVARYKQGAEVVLDGTSAVADGYVWGSYMGAQSGKRRWVAVWALDGSETLFKKVG